MNTPRPPQDPDRSRAPADADARSERRDERARDEASIQPPATGANRGSPAAPVMKEFSKTEAESGGPSNEQATPEKS